MSGSACTNEVARCDGLMTDAGCTTYGVSANAVGDCSVDVVLVDGRHVLRDVSIVKGGSACSGYSAANSSGEDFIDLAAILDGGGD